MNASEWRELQRIREERALLDEQEARLNARWERRKAEAGLVRAALAFADNMTAMWTERPDLRPGDTTATRLVDAVNACRRTGVFDAWLDASPGDSDVSAIEEYIKAERAAKVAQQIGDAAGSPFRPPPAGSIAAWLDRKADGQ